ncbi:MAG: ABC transporter permease [Methanoregulaceae archaeon]|nr:ABC transporter permease [Methanoregulaceae archaeon]
MTAWARRTVRTYFGNAAAVREYRAQLRGNRALYLWAAYLGLLILLGGLAYSQIMDNEYAQSIATLQSELNSFYSTIIGMIAAVVCLVAPALTASSITAERQRRSLDLVFSAPVPPRYLLVGKMIASMRYLMMLLVLALPVTAVCVVMGGATWSDVVGSYIVLLSSGIVFMAIGLAVSAQAPTLMSSIVNTYIGVGAYLWFTSIFGMVFLASRFGGGPLGMGSTNEAPWSVVLLPFTAAYTSPTFTIISGVEVPNWILGLVFALAFSRLLLSGAGSALSPFGSPETKSLRIHGIVFLALLGVLVAFPLSASTPFAMLGAPATGPSTQGYTFGVLVASVSMIAFWLIPALVCHAPDADRKFRYDGLFSLRQAIVGSPSGALPYLLFLWGTVVAVFVAVYAFSARAMLGVQFWQLSAWGLGFIVFWWGVARFFSSMGMNLKSARSSVIATGIVVLALPLPILSSLTFTSYGTSSPSQTSLWMLHMAYPLAPGETVYAPYYAAFLVVSGIALALAGEANMKRPRRQRRAGSAE